MANFSHETIKSRLLRIVTLGPKRMWDRLRIEDRDVMSEVGLICKSSGCVHACRMCANEREEHVISRKSLPTQADLHGESQ